MHISNSSEVRSTRLYHFEHERQNTADNVRQNVSRGHKTGNSLQTETALAQDVGTGRASSPYKCLWIFISGIAQKSQQTTVERLCTGAIDSAVLEDEWTLRLETNGIFIHFVLKTSAPANTWKFAKNDESTGGKKEISVTGKQVRS